MYFGNILQLLYEIFLIFFHLVRECLLYSPKKSKENYVFQGRFFLLAKFTKRVTIFFNSFPMRGILDKINIK